MKDSDRATKKVKRQAVMIEPCVSRIGKATLHMYLPLQNAQKNFEANQAGAIDLETGETLEQKAKRTQLMQHKRKMLIAQQ